MSTQLIRHPGDGTRQGVARKLPSAAGCPAGLILRFDSAPRAAGVGSCFGTAGVEVLHTLPPARRAVARTHVQRAHTHPVHAGLLAALFVVIVLVARSPRPQPPSPSAASPADAPTAAGNTNDHAAANANDSSAPQLPAGTRPVSPDVTTDESGRLQWPRPRVADRQDERDRMVAAQIARGDLFREAVTDRRVLAACRAVPRHEFVPEDRRGEAYADTPVPIGHGQTISQPYIVALMTELLQVEPGDKLLEIGTGSGYQAAILSELTPWVFSMEIIEPLHRQAAERLERLGYKTIRTQAADGYEGWAEMAPFDGVIVTCAAGHVPPPLWEQLAPGGRMVVPIGGPHDVQRLVVLTKQPDGSRRSQTVIPVAFVPMTGRVEKP